MLDRYAGLFEGDRSQRAERGMPPVGVVVILQEDTAAHRLPNRDASTLRGEAHLTRHSSVIREARTSGPGHSLMG